MKNWKRIVLLLCLILVCACKNAKSAEENIVLQQIVPDFIDDVGSNLLNEINLFNYLIVNLYGEYSIFSISHEDEEIVLVHEDFSIYIALTHGTDFSQRTKVSFFEEYENNPGMYFQIGDAHYFGRYLEKAEKDSDSHGYRAVIIKDGIVCNMFFYFNNEEFKEIAEKIILSARFINITSE